MADNKKGTARIQIMIAASKVEDEEIVQIDTKDGVQSYAFVGSDGLPTAGEPSSFHSTEAAKSWLRANGLPLINYIIVQTKARVRGENQTKLVLEDLPLGTPPSVA